jgi:hypothetical protein
MATVLRAPGVERRWARAATLAIGAFVLVLTLGASPAAAHGGVQDSTNWRSEILDPGDQRLDWSVLGGDALLSLHNRTGQTVVVQGYEGEPYLRFVPGDGVYENQRSPATFLNQDRYAGVELPARADATAEPDWRRVAGGDRHEWHDHRTHWMSPERPPAVVAAPDERQLVLSWTVPVTVGEGDAARSLAARGELWWVPGVNGLLYVVGAAVVAAVGFTVAVVCSRVSGNRWRGLARPVTVMAAIVWFGDVVRTVDDIVAVPASVFDQFVYVGVVVAALVAIAAMIVRGWRGDVGGFFALAAAGLLLMLMYAAEQSDQLSASQITTELPIWVRRWTIAASWMIVLPTFGAAVLAARRLESGLVRRARRLATG